MAEAYLVGGVRTPQGKYGGAPAGVRPDDLAALVVREAVARAGVPGAAIDEVVLGTANQAGEAVPATEKAFARAGWGVSDLEAVELNEAFAVQSLAVICRLKLDEERVNADGGAIALGHPLGCSGARLTVTLLGRMEREGARRGLATLCVGVGQGVAMLVERP